MLTEDKLQELVSKAKSEAINYLLDAIPCPERCEFCKHYIEVEEGEYKCEKQILSEAEPPLKECTEGVIGYYLKYQIQEYEEEGKNERF